MVSSKINSVRHATKAGTFLDNLEAVSKPVSETEQSDALSSTSLD